MFQGEKDSPNTSSYEVWADSMEKIYGAKDREQLSRTGPSTIHRVPDCIRIVDEGAYEPQMLSIGPYHRSKPKLKAMEDCKWHCLRRVLCGRRLSDYLREMEGLEVQVRGFYSENEEIKRIGSKEFVEMMLLDGCFILELLLQTESENVDGEVNNPIYSTTWILPIIRLDMLLLENQLPFLVVNRIFQLRNGSNNSFPVDLAVDFFYDVMPIKKDRTVQMDSFHHLLEFFHRHLLPVNSRVTVETVCKQPQSPPSMPSATEIRDSGIKLLRSKGTSSILDVQFSSEKAVLEIPRLCIDYSTNSIFRNLIAWEQCNPASGNYFTGYSIFMDCLIDTPQDVALLKWRGIIRRWFGTDEQVALLFNKLCIGIPINSAFERSFLYDLSLEVENFRSRRWSKWQALLMRDYLRNPWDYINYQFTAMTIIFTIVQTVLAVISLKRSS